MQTQVALGFVWRLLNDGQRLAAKDHWNQFPRGRYQTPFELFRKCKVEPPEKPITEEMQDSMKLTWIDWCKENDHDQEGLPWDHETWFVWLDYAARSYQEVLPEIRSDWNEVNA